MGCGGGKEAGGGDDDDSPDVGGNSAADAASKELEMELERQNAAENAIIKLLVLGTGESGKSTVFKQMKILYSVPDPPAKFIAICRANLIGNAQTVIEGMAKLNIEFETPEGKAGAEFVKGLPSDGNVDNAEAVLKPLKDLRADSGTLKAIERANEYQLNDSTGYFWDRAAEILASDYTPTDQDVLRARVRTTGIVQQNFQIGEKKYTMFDVGGQRNERRKWIHCFDNVTAVIFVTAISEYDQMLYEDENTNRMDEALILFEQICNHPSFKKTSMILFLNKLDLFEMKLAKKDMSSWRDPKDWPEIATLGKDYDKNIVYLKKEFLEKNKDPLVRQVYVHATCATDTNNIAFVMESVFDIILKDNLRKLAKVDLSKIIDISGGTGISTVKTATADKMEALVAPDAQGKIILSALWYTESLSERKVMVSSTGVLPSVVLMSGKGIQDSDWSWVMGLGKDLPKMPVFPAEAGSFKGSFKEAADKLVAMLGNPETLGSVYDFAVEEKSGDKMTITLACVKKLKEQVALPGFKYVEHEEFENAHYKSFAGVDTDAKPCAAPKKGEEFDPFAPNPVGYRWFKGVTLFTKEVLKTPDKGVYLGIFKVCSTTDGFKIMVNEHNRILIPMIFLTESQLTPEEATWMHGVRIREDKFKIDLLEGKQPNRGWLGPEMSGEEGATFPEKLWWAIDEAKSRLNTENIGFQYDKELLFIDENNNIQLLVFGMLAKDEADILPGHIWVTRDNLEVQSMKYLCPVVLQAMLTETQIKINEYQTLAANDSGTMDDAAKNRAAKEKVKEEIEKLFVSQTPLKWVNRLIMWCADKMPSFGATYDGANADEVVKKAIASNSEIDAVHTQRDQIVKKYKGATKA